MHSYNKPTRPYYPPNTTHLKDARDKLLVRPEYNTERYKVSAMIDPLTQSGNPDLVIAFWVFHLQSHRTDSSNTEAKGTPQEDLAKYALNISSQNECDAATRIRYLVKFIQGYEVVQRHPLEGTWGQDLSSNKPTTCVVWKPSEEDRQLALYHIACLLFEMNLINDPATAIDRFGSIPNDYEFAKKTEPSGFVAFAKTIARNIGFNHDEDRDRQVAFIKVMHQLLLKFNNDKSKEKFCSYLENHTEAVAITIAMEIEEETTDHNPNSKLHQILMSKLGYNKNAHTCVITENIKKMRLTQLMTFLSKITDDDFDEAAAHTNCSRKALDDCREHYFKGYRKLLPKLRDTTIVPRSSSEAALRNISQTTWAITTTLLTWTIPSAAQKAYYGTGLDKVASTIAYCASKEAGAKFRPAARWLVEFSLKHGGSAALDGAAITGIEAALYYYLLGNSNPKEQKYLTGASQISFTDFITLCLDSAIKAKDQKYITLYQDILYIFPLLPYEIQRAFDRNVPALYFVPNALKPKCPFKIEMIPQSTSENVEKPEPEIPSLQSAYNPLFSPPPAPIPQASAPPAQPEDWVVCEPPPYTTATQVFGK